MSLFIAAIMFVPLLAIAIAHFLWSIGRSWPIRDPALLAPAVVGFRGVTRVPRFSSFVIAVGVFIAGVIGLALADPVSGGIPLDVLGGMLALIFLARGFIGYTSWWAARTPVEPFRTLDRRNYSPLCLILGAGFLALVVLRFI